MSWTTCPDRKTKNEDDIKRKVERNGGNKVKEKLSKLVKIHTAKKMLGIINDNDTRVVNQQKFYLGTLDGQKVAVVKIPEAVMKKLKIEPSMIKQFNTLSRPRGIKVSGCCLETSYPLLVYEHCVDENRALCGCIGGGGGVLDLESGEVTEERLLTKLEGVANEWKNLSL